LKTEGALSANGGPAEFGALIRAETLKWTAVIKVSGARAQ
jgi:hypothetical protein